MSNQFEIATRDEPLSVQRGVVAAYSKLHLLRGIYDAPYQGDVYVLDAITNNPGAAGGALTTQSGELLGIIGKELKNGLSNTWVNYAVPVSAAVEVRQGEQTATLSLPEFVAKGVPVGRRLIAQVNPDRWQRGHLRAERLGNGVQGCPEARCQVVDVAGGERVRAVAQLETARLTRFPLRFGRHVPPWVHSPCRATGSGRPTADDQVLSRRPFATSPAASPEAPGGRRAAARHAGGRR